MSALHPQEDLVDRAAALWSTTVPAGTPPLRVEKLKRGWRSSAVLRLFGAGPKGESIVAKCAERHSVEREAHVYFEVLAKLGMSAPRCFGVAPDGAVAWLFLEDVGDGRFDSRRPSHRRLAASWMARAHGGAISLPRLAEMPERGPHHYRALLRAVERLLRGALANPAMSEEEAATVKVLGERVRTLETGWSIVAESIERTPDTIAFGGFSGKNARVRESPDGPVLVPFDFESAGHGSPAIDLVHVDGDVYVEEARGWWGLDIEEFERLQEAGRLLGVLKAIPGERRRLLGPAPSEAVAELRWYEPMIRVGAIAA